MAAKTKPIDNKPVEIGLRTEKANSTLSMYGTTTGFKEYSGVVEQVIMGQVWEWGVFPDKMFGIGLERAFIGDLAKKAGMSMGQYMYFFQDKQTRVEFATGNAELKKVEDGVQGGRIELSIGGSFDHLVEKRTLLRRTLKRFEADAELTGAVRSSESASLSEIPYRGKNVISGPGYAIDGLKRFFDGGRGASYRFNLVSKAQIMAFVEKFTM
jgi:hypothetical protein